MPAKPRALLLSSILISFPFPVAFCQDAPSLGDTARHARQQEQEKGQPGKGPAASKVVKVLTDDEAPQPTQEPAPASPASDQGRPAKKTATIPGIPKLPAEEWKAKILAQKNGITAMQTMIDKLNASIRFVAASCAGCQEWNERQLQKQKEVERARAQLEEQKQRLAEMQQAARQQGYGSSVYDP
jgi:hypothetical protein